MHEVLEQQHEHDVDAHDAGQHGERKTLEQFAHRFRIADGLDRDAGRQLLHAWQFHRLRFDLAERLPVQFDLDVDVADAVVAVDDGRATAELDAGDVGQHHRAVRAGDGQP